MTYYSEHTEWFRARGYHAIAEKIYDKWFLRVEAKGLPVYRENGKDLGVLVNNAKKHIEEVQSVEW